MSKVLPKIVRCGACANAKGPDGICRRCYPAKKASDDMKSSLDQPPKVLSTLLGPIPLDATPPPPPNLIPCLKCGKPTHRGRCRGSHAQEQLMKVETKVARCQACGGRLNTFNGLCVRCDTKGDSVAATPAQTGISLPDCNPAVETVNRGETNRPATEDVKAEVFLPEPVAMPPVDTKHLGSIAATRITSKPPYTPLTVELDPEIAAIEALVVKLVPLDLAARKRVLSYCCSRFG